MSSAATDNLTAADPKPDAGLMISVSFLLIAVPFAYSHSVFDTGLMPKFLALMIGSVFVVLSWLRMEYRGEAFHVSLPTDLPVFLYLLIVALQWPRAYDVYQASLEVIKVFTFTAIYMAITRCSVPAHWRVWTSILVVVGTVVSAIGICQYLGVGFLWLPSAGFPSGTFGYRNTAAMFIITVLPFAILKFVQAMGLRKEVLWSASLTVIGVFLVYTRTRGAWVGVSVSACAALILIVCRGGWITLELSRVFGFARLRKGLTAIGAILIVAAASTIPPFSGLVSLGQASPLPPEKQDVGDAIHSVLLNTSDMVEGHQVSGSGRTGLWMSTLEMIRDHPFVGVGLTNWEKIYPVYRMSQSFNNRFPRRPHNDYLYAWSELGVLGFAAYALIAIAACVSMANRVRQQNTTWVGLGVAALSGLIAVQTHALFSFPRERPGALIGAGVCLALVGSVSRAGSIRRSSGRELSAPLMASFLICLGSSVIARASVSEAMTVAAISHNATVRFEEASGVAAAARRTGIFDYRHLIHHSEIAHRAGQGDATFQICEEVVLRHPNSVNGLQNLGMISLSLLRYQDAVVAYQRAVALRPDRLTLYKALGETFERLSRLDEALQTYEQALTSGHRSSWVLCKVAEICFRLGKYDRAYANFKRALELQPDYARAIFGLGNVYLARGKKDQAIDAYIRGLDLEADNAKAHYALAYIYISQGKRAVAVRHLIVALANAEDVVMRREISSILAKGVKQ